MVEEAVARFGRIDVLVNNAGCNVRKPAMQVEESDWDKVRHQPKAVFFAPRSLAAL